MSDRLTSQQIICGTLMKMVVIINILKIIMLMIIFFCDNAALMMLNCLRVSDYKQVVFYEVATL